MQTPLPHAAKPAICKDRFLREAQEIYRRRFSHLNLPEEATCLLWAIAGCSAAGLQGHRGIVQAGTANFRCVSEAKDDGVGINSFGYVFDVRAALPLVRAGLFPEMHAWMALPDLTPHPVIVDLSIGFQPLQLRKMLGRDWDPDVTPPPYLWASVDDMPEHWVYQADPIATQLALWLASGYPRS